MRWALDDAACLEMPPALLLIQHKSDRAGCPILFAVLAERMGKRGANPWDRIHITMPPIDASPIQFRDSSSRKRESRSADRTPAVRGHPARTGWHKQILRGLRRTITSSFNEGIPYTTARAVLFLPRAGIDCMEMVLRRPFVFARPCLSKTGVAARRNRCDRVPFSLAETAERRLHENAEFALETLVCEGLRRIALSVGSLP
jgi:hypothetical protein